MSRDWTLSVLIPTVGRDDLVIETIQSLLKQSFLPKEIIVVDQNNPPLKKLDEYLASVPCVRHVRSSVKGVSLNYNRCFREASGDVVLYLDDDVIPHRDLIKNHLRNYIDRPKLGGVAGKVLEPDQKFSEDARTGHYARWRGVVSGNFNARERQPVQLSQGANMSFRREILEDVGGFDLGFDGNGYFFESDGCLRVKRQGAEIVFDPTAEVFHLMAPSGGARVKDKSVHTYFL